jgi:hypothetical protein
MSTAPTLNTELAKHAPTGGQFAARGEQRTFLDVQVVRDCLEGGPTYS